MSIISFFQVIDGAKYVFLPKNISKSEAQISLKNNSNFFFNSPKTRVIWEDNLISKTVIESLQEVSKEGGSFFIKPYETTFLNIGPDYFNNLETIAGNLDWLNYADQFSYKLIDKNSDLEKDILLDFVLESFGVSFQENQIIENQNKKKLIRSSFISSLLDKRNQFILIQDKQKNPLAVYNLVILNSEIQLHSVEGKTSLPFQFSVKKLPVIWASLINILNKDTFLNKFYDLGLNPDLGIKLTFSSSKPKVCDYYLGFGAKIDSSRYGYFVEKKSMEN